MDRTQGFPQTWKEGRRKRTLEFKQRGWQQCEIEEACGVSAVAEAPALDPHMPIEQAAHRDDAAIQQWRVQVRPELRKGAHRRSDHGLCGRLGSVPLAGTG